MEDSKMVINSTTIKESNGVVLLCVTIDNKPKMFE